MNPWIFLGFMLYLAIGCIFHVLAIETNATISYYHRAGIKDKMWVTFCDVVFWWMVLLLGVFLMLDYEARLRLGRWAVLLACIIALTVYGPDLRRQLRGGIEVEQPLTAPVATSNDTIRERPWEPTSRFEMYYDDENPQ